MYRRVSTLVVLLLALTVGRAGADQIYGVFDSSLTAGGEYYTLAVQNLVDDVDTTPAEIPVATGVQKVEIPVPNGTFAKLACVIDTAPGLGAGWTFTLIKNGSPTPLICSVSNTTTGRSCPNDTDEIPVVTGDLVTLQIEGIGAPVATGGSCTLRLR
jgi:hypothetical protein